MVSHNKVDDRFVRREGLMTLWYCHCLLSRWRWLESQGTLCLQLYGRHHIWMIGVMAGWQYQEPMPYQYWHNYSAILSKKRERRWQKEAGRWTDDNVSTIMACKTEVEAAWWWVINKAHSYIFWCMNACKVYQRPSCKSTITRCKVDTIDDGHADYLVIEKSKVWPYTYSSLQSQWKRGRHQTIWWSMSTTCILDDMVARHHMLTYGKVLRSLHRPTMSFESNGCILICMP